MRKTDQISALVLLAAAGFVGIGAWKLAIWSGPGIPGPGFLPLLLAVGLAVGAAGIFLEAARAGTEDGVKWFTDRESILRLAVLLVCIVALVAAIEPLGMLLAVGLFLLVFLAIYLKGHWLAILLIAGGTPVCLYLIFAKWLKFSLPQGFLGF
jgi:putative tricarboxylic transport membrane protein